eukprot:2700268-Prymnesium_polylepis.1
MGSSAVASKVSDLSAPRGLPNWDSAEGQRLRRGGCRHRAREGEGERERAEVRLRAPHSR